MSDFTSRPDDSLDQWLADQHRDMVTDLAATLDVDAGLREAMIPARHADLVADLGGVLNVEAGLSAIVPAPPPGKREVPAGTAGELAGTAEFLETAVSRGARMRSALLVGCSDYADPNFPRLLASVQDVGALTRVLDDPAVGDFIVKESLNEPSRAVRERIKDFFANRKHDDLLLLYFSCHGVLDRSGRLYFVASDTRNELLDSTGISARWVRRQMGKSRSRRIVLLLDCCYGGAFAAGPTRRSAGAGEILAQLGGRGRVVITASDKTEVARGSEFTNAVVQGLGTGAADLDGDGQISDCELYQYVSGQVRQSRPDQTPTMSRDGMRGPLCLARNSHVESPLPDKLERSLKSETEWERLWAVDGLPRLLDGDHPGGQKRRARQVLLDLSEGADLGMRAAAGEALRRASRRTDPRPHRARWLVVVSLGLVLAVLGAVLFTVMGRFLESPISNAPPDKSIVCSPSAKTADGVLSLGTLFPKTGAFAYSGPALDAGVQLAMKDINAAGGIPGIVMKKLDEANQRDESNLSADTARQSTDALLAGGADVIIGPSTSAVALEVIDKVVCAGVIMFSPGNTSPVFTTYRDHGRYFRTAPSSVLEGAVLGKLVVADGNSTAVVISRDDAYGNPLREMTVKAIQESGGQVLDSFHYDPNALGRHKEIQRVKAKNPDAIVLIGFVESAQILAGMIKEGLGPKNKRVYGPDANMTNTLVGQVSPRDPSALAGMRGILMDAGGEAFVKRLREVNPGLRDLTYAAQAHDAVVVTVLAAAVAGTDEPAAIAKEINGVTKTGAKCTSFAACMALVKDRKDIDYDGPSGPLEFSDPGEPRSATYVVSEIQADGTIKSLRRETVGS
ncbi:MAG: caspase, EACC1-associated type [Pseudonocardiaceae bacterium]